MAVRSFDLTSARSTRLVALETAPPRRRDLRRSRQRWAMLAGILVIIPFASALVVLGVVH